MDELNTFNTEGPEDLSDAFTAITWGVLGFVALFVVFAMTVIRVGAWLPLTVSAALFTGSTAAALRSVAWRPVAAGLTFASGVTTLASFLFLGFAVGGVG